MRHADSLNAELARDSDTLGGVRERPNRHAWKACEVQASVGSNPTPSAMATDAELDAMELALILARDATTAGEVPVGAVVLRAGEVIAARRNEREATNDPTAHAEVLALRDAASVVGSWNLSGCTLVVTLEPCPMCAGAILNSRVSRLVFGAADPKAGATGTLYNLMSDPRLNHDVDVEHGCRADESRELLTRFFADKR